MSQRPLARWRRPAGRGVRPLLATALAAAMLGAACAGQPTPTASSAEPTPSASAEPAASASADPTTSPDPPEASPAVTVVALTIERRTTDDATRGFADDALAILTDRRGWGRAGFVFEVADDAPYRLVLAEGDEVDRLCLPYDTYGQYSCQNGPVVALNADRWREATPEWTGSLADYRVMLVNHEVGHLLHLHHPDPQCPGEGWPAPVMAQQSTELGACTANPWPLPWEVDLAAGRREPLAPPADHETSDHHPVAPRQRQDPDVA